MTLRFAPLACALALTLMGTASASPESVVLVQRSNGFPGGEQASQLARQEVAIEGPRLRVLDRQHRWALFIDLEARRVQEVAVDRREYTERGFDYYQRYRTERQENLADQAKDWLRRKERLEEGSRRLREHIDAYRRAGGDPQQPGRIVARLQYYPQDRREATLLVDREPRTIGLEHYVIRENQADRPVFDLWITRQLSLPVDVVPFYRELGTFSPEVTAQLQKVPGVIVECTAVLDTGTLKKEFVSQLLEVRPGEHPAGALSVPAGFKRVEPGETTQEAAGPPQVCAVCGGQIEGEGLRYREPWGKRRLFVVCSPEHRVEIIRRVSDERGRAGE